MITYQGEIFDKVLYRNCDGEMWNVSFYVGCRYTNNNVFEQYVLGENESVQQIIPYNDSTACLLLTFNETPPRYAAKEKIQSDYEDSELSLEMIYSVLDACIRRNNIYSVSYTGSDLLIEDARKSPLNRDVYDSAMYVIHNGGSMQLHRIEIPKTFKKPTTCDFDREIIYKIANYLYQVDDEFMECFNDIISDTEGTITPISSYNYVLDTIVTEEISHIGE